MSLYFRDSSSNLITVAATTVTFQTNVFTNLMHLLDFRVEVPSVRTTDPWAGQNIGIQFESIVAPNLIGGVWDLDNVRLSETTATTLTQPKLDGGQFHFTLQSEPGLSFEIQANTNLTQSASGWTSLGTLTNTTGAAVFTDTTGESKRRFYRARAL
jgi:hypothetical protein